MSEATMEYMVEITGLRVSFPTDKGTIFPVDGVDLKIVKGETLGLVGESGSGKSMTSLALMGLVPKPNGRITGGSIRFNGKELVGLPEAEMRTIRGQDISMIFQEPMTSLNPVYTVGAQIVEAIRTHKKVPRNEARQTAIEMLRRVGIPSPEKRVDAYPHLLSGGMRQRVMIAMALSLGPALLIADEPTTALDVTIQAQILDLMNDLQRDFGMSILLITHNMGLVAENATRIAVMYAGRILEEASTEELFRSPSHPYTQGLLASIPRMQGEEKELKAIQGMVPALYELPEGCKFSNRCELAGDECTNGEPPLFDITDSSSAQTGKSHLVRCWRFAKGRL
ncbi:MAG: ABC transporter ATP-binding protein [Synergistaceae bacterium]|nr:ABC transporter ATP-binding protein [Synergistaceae bacterium]